MESRRRHTILQGDWSSDVCSSDLIFRARKTSMLIYAFCVIPVIFAQLLGSVNMWLAVIIIGLAASAHQAWSANIFTTVSDMFPKRAVASVTGIGGMAGDRKSVV